VLHKWDDLSARETGCVQVPYRELFLVGGVAEGQNNPVTFFVARVLLQDEGVLACWPRHDCRPQSSMIRGVLSPGSGRCRRDR
jgi:hypothetical protein